MTDTNPIDRALPEDFSDKFFDRDDVCALMKISRRKLWQLEKSGEAPPSVNLNGAVRYSKRTLEQYMRNLFEVAS